ncbi:histone-lysine N-methyltransferase SETMAR [Trichonephila clavipes]|nr:histone-lysine N-methyltransferase SETMAR [Trichonephila clavipes]
MYILRSRDPLKIGFAEIHLQVNAQDTDTSFVCTLGGTWYCDTLSKLKEAIRKKRPVFLGSGVLLDDSATTTQNRIATLVSEHLHHPPYSLDLIPSDFHLFPALKKNLAGRSFGSNAEVKLAVKLLFHMQSPEFFLEGFLKFIQAV